ncbi:asparaginase domain-containing protein [Patescibacteria group bacterium]|nr:asparaginase domain-containing protein [Patescibacteria group bacterium]
MKSLRIAVISCGGTILMEKGKSGALEPKKSVESVLSAINLKDISPFLEIKKKNVYELFRLDSTNLNQIHWKKIISKILEIQDDYDGILIFHGTDTMAYSATAVGLVMCQNLKVPVVFTGAQKPIGETGSDAISNVERSLLVLREAIREGIVESMIFFGHEAYRGVNSRKKSESQFEAFESPNYRPLFVVDGMGAKIGLIGRKKKDIENTKKKIRVKIENEFANGIVPLSVVPGLEPEVLISIAKRDFCSLIILNSLGVGNLPSEGKYSFVPAIEYITKKLKKLIVVTSPFVGGDVDMNVYEPGKLASQAGAIDAGSMTPEATLVKIRLLFAHPEFSRSKRDFQNALLSNFAGENSSKL